MSSNLCTWTGVGCQPARLFSSDEAACKLIDVGSAGGGRCAETRNYGSDGRGYDYGDSCTIGVQGTGTIQSVGQFGISSESNLRVRGSGYTTGDSLVTGFLPPNHQQSFHHGEEYQKVLKLVSDGDTITWHGGANYDWKKNILYGWKVCVRGHSAVPNAM